MTSCTQLGSRRLLRNRREGDLYAIRYRNRAFGWVVALFARYVGFDRDRAFYPTVMIVIASYYVLFAVMSGSVQTVVIESVVMTLFAAAAVAGFKSSAWIVVAALAGHGVFDCRSWPRYRERRGAGLVAGLVSRVRRRRCSRPCLAFLEEARFGGPDGSTSQ